MTIASRISRKIGDKLNPLLAPSRRAKLERTEFTIISNNCWAGSVYRRYGLPYLSPTAGLYFFADDFVRFAGALRRYTSAPLRFIDAADSRHADLLAQKGELKKIVGGGRRRRDRVPPLCYEGGGSGEVATEVRPHQLGQPVHQVQPDERLHRG